MILVRMGRSLTAVCTFPWSLVMLRISLAIWMPWFCLVFKLTQIGPGIFMLSSNLASPWEVGGAGAESTLRLSMSHVPSGASPLPSP